MTAAHRERPSRLRTALIPLVGLATGLLVAVIVPSQMAQAAPSTVATDTFTRTVASSWGSATSGGAWSLSKTGSTKFSVASGAGVISGLAKGTSASAALNGVNAQDVDTVGTIGLPAKASSLFSAFEIRSQSDGSRYRGRLNVGTSGNASLALSRLNKKTEVSLATVLLPFKANPGSSISVEFQVVGTSPVAIEGRAWIAGTAKPTAWNLAYTDSSASRITAAGSVGLWQYAGSGNTAPLTTTLDNLVVVKDPTAGTTPPPVVVTPPPAAPEPSRGSATVGTTDYAIPSGALFVSPSGSDSAAGTLNAPLQTIAAAVAKANGGQTIVLRAGVYNESVTIPIDKPLTIQSYPDEAVWLDGSQQVTKWTQSGNTWTTPWSFFPSNLFDGVADNPRYVNSAYPMAGRTDMAFYDGAQLTQVASASQVTAGTFAADPQTKTITIGSNPAGHEVRISNKGQAFNVIAPHTTLQGFGVRRYASDPQTIGAVRFQNTNETARNLDIEDTGDIGLNLSNNAGTLDHLTVLRAGLLGVGINASYGFSLTNSIVDDNNYSHFNAAPVSGGVKVTRSRGVTITNNEFNGNLSTGFWCDESCYDVTVANNTAENNTDNGIMLELSQKAIVANNVVSGSNTNIEIRDTGDVQLINNTIGASGLFGIQLSQDTRRNTDLSVPGHDPRQPEPDPTVPWITKNVQIENTAFGASGPGFQIYGLDMVDMNVTITGNMFNQRMTAQQPTLLAWGTSAGTSDYIHYQTPADIDALNSTWQNQQTTGVVPVASMAPLLTTAAPAIAVPLPADVAAIVGQPVGTKHIGAF